MPALKEYKKQTPEDWEALPENQPAELIDGVIYDVAAPSTMHQWLVTRIASRIDRYIDDHGGACRVYVAPFAVALDEDRLEPDISVICDPDKIDEKGCNGAPDWIIEVTSPATRSRDYVYKLNKYLTYGCREYWIVNPDSRTVVVFDFTGGTGSDTYHFENDIPVGIYPGFSIRIAELIR